jgi:hypothetical protein
MPDMFYFYPGWQKSSASNPGTARLATARAKSHFACISVAMKTLPDSILVAREHLPKAIGACNCQKALYSLFQNIQLH